MERMDNKNKIVTQLPLTSLWTDDRHISAKRLGHLTLDQIRETLKKYPVEFVVADVGHKLKWISSDKSFEFWKSELIPHLAQDIGNIKLDNFIDNYAYVASEWTGDAKTRVILLEKHH